MRRNSGGIRLAAFTAFFALFTVPKTLIKYSIKGDFQFLKAFCKGIIANLKMSSYSPI
jgi:hypothetical protein